MSFEHVCGVDFVCVCVQLCEHRHTCMRVNERTRGCVCEFCFLKFCIFVNKHPISRSYVRQRCKRTHKDKNIRCFFSLLFVSLQRASCYSRAVKQLHNTQFERHLYQGNIWKFHWKRFCRRNRQFYVSNDATSVWSQSNGSNYKYLWCKNALDN